MGVAKFTEFNGLKLFNGQADEVVGMIQSEIPMRPFYIVTPNADHFARLDDPKNVEFIDAYKHADLRLCDSRIVQKVAALRGQRIPRVITGSDLTKTILAAEWASNTDMLVIGPSATDVDVIKNRFSLSALSSYSPPMGFISDPIEVERCIAAVLGSCAEIIFIAVGSPQQEVLATRIKERLLTEETSRRCIMLCVGASFDFLSGKERRAPVLLQKLHLEWLYRLLSNPAKLFPRYLSNFRWLVSYLCHGERKRKRR